jgi:hypothetical protein
MQVLVTAARGYSVDAGQLQQMGFSAEELQRL